MFSLGASFLPSPRGILGLREFCSFSTEYDASLYVREPKATNQHADGYVDIEESVDDRLVTPDNLATSS